MWNTNFKVKFMLNLKKLKQASSVMNCLAIVLGRQFMNRAENLPRFAEKRRFRRSTAFPWRTARSAIVSDLQSAPDRRWFVESEDRTILGVRSRV